MLYRLATLHRPVTQLNRWLITRLLGLVLPLLAAFYLVLHPALDATAPKNPAIDLIVVGSASLLAASFAYFLLITTARIQHSRVFFLAYGFIAYAAFSILHTLTVPGLIFHPTLTPDAVSATAGYLSLFFAAVFFVLAQTRAAIAISNLATRLRSTGFLTVLGAIIFAFTALATYRPTAITSLALSALPRSAALGSLTILLLSYAAYHYLKSYRETGLPLQLNLAAGMLFFIVAQIILVIAPWGTWSELLYHYASLAGLTLALRSLLVQRHGGASLRSLVEEGLEIKVNLPAEVQSLNALAALSAAIEARDNDTAGHNDRVANLSVRVGRTMGLDNARLRVLAHAGLLHDIGKLAMPDAVLHKPGPLTEEEMAIMKTHPLRGLDILAKLGKFDQETAVIMTHHERIDGSGYPHGLMGNLIPIEGRILAVVDTYDAIVSDRPYRAGRPTAVALALLRQESGITLDAGCIEALIQAIESPRAKNAVVQNSGARLGKSALARA